VTPPVPANSVPTPVPPPGASAAISAAPPPNHPGQTPGGPGPSGSRRGLWIAVGVLAVLVVVAAVVAAVLLLRGDGTNVAASTTTTAQIVASSTTTTVLPTTTATVPSTTTTTTAVAAAPGDSPGKWVEVPVPSVPVTVQYASLSDSALLLETGDETSSKIYAYMLGSSSLIELPVKSPQAGATTSTVTSLSGGRAPITTPPVRTPTSTFTRTSFPMDR